MKHSLMAMMAAATLIAVPSSAFAQGSQPDWANKNGAFGIGGNTSLGGTNGIHVRTYVTPLIGVDLTFGFALFNETRDTGGVDVTESTTQFDIGVYGTYKLAYWQRGHLSALLGFDVVTNSTSVEPDGGDSIDVDGSTNILIGLGLQGEWFPTQYLSLFAQGGLRLDFLSEDDYTVAGPDMPETQSGFDINIGGDLLGAAGFTVWFK